MSLSSFVADIENWFKKEKVQVGDIVDNVIFTKRTLVVVAFVVGIFFAAEVLKPWSWQLTCVAIALILVEGAIIWKRHDSNTQLRILRMKIVAEGKPLTPAPLNPGTGIGTGVINTPTAGPTAMRVASPMRGPIPPVPPQVAAAAAAQAAPAPPAPAQSG
jgi:hypothetical protein